MTRMKDDERAALLAIYQGTSLACIPAHFVAMWQRVGWLSMAGKLTDRGKHVAITQAAGGETSHNGTLYGREGEGVDRLFGRPPNPSDQGPLRDRPGGHDDAARDLGEGSGQSSANGNDRDDALPEAGGTE